MAEGSSVPYNFGVEYFDSNPHSNIEIILKDGSRVKANTVILSKNSSYFKELIESKNPKTIEVDDVDSNVSKGFLKCFYTGDFGILDEDNFRQVSKLSFTFQVTWMQNKCLACFKNMINNHHNNESKFLLDEAIAAKEFDKSCLYLNALAQSKTENVCIEDIKFMETNLQDMESISVDDLDFFIRLANVCNRNLNTSKNGRNRRSGIGFAGGNSGNCSQNEYCIVLVKAVTAHLETIGKIDVKTRHVLEKLDFKEIAAKFIQNNRNGNPYGHHYNYQQVDPFKKAALSFFQSLLDLQDISNEDLKMTLRQHMSLGN